LPSESFMVANVPQGCFWGGPVNFQKVGTNGPGTSNRPAFDPAAESAAYRRAGLHGPDAMDSNETSVNLNAG